MTVDTTKPLQLSFVDKYGVKFYSMIVVQVITLYMIFHLHNSQLALSFSAFMNIIGVYLPMKAKDDPDWNKAQKNNAWLLGPVVASCLSTPIILAYCWLHYDYIINASLGEAITTFLTIQFSISGSIDASHELLHRPEPWCKVLCYLNLFFFQFTVYPTEHLYMHHKKVGTPEDPITSPKGHSVLRYYFNALFSSHKFSYSYDKKVFAANIGATTLYNVLLVALALKEGSSIEKALFFSGISYMTLWTMEEVEYIEHYGLIFRKDVKQKPVSQICSWNTDDNQLLNWLVFRFQRHSDHHMNAYKLYPTFINNDKMPQFPFDFMSGIIVCKIPPLWYYLIDPLVDQVIEGKKASPEHIKFVKNFFRTLQFVLLMMFPLNLAGYLL